MKKYGPQTDTSAISSSDTGRHDLQLIEYTATDNIQNDINSSINNNNNDSSGPDSSPEIYDEFLQHPLEHSRLLEPNNN